MLRLRRPPPSRHAPPHTHKKKTTRRAPCARTAEGQMLRICCCGLVSAHMDEHAQEAGAHARTHIHTHVHMRRRTHGRAASARAGAQDSRLGSARRDGILGGSDPPTHRASSSHILLPSPPTHPIWPVSRSPAYYPAACRPPPSPLSRQSPVAQPPESVGPSPLPSSSLATAQARGPSSTCARPGEGEGGGGARGRGRGRAGKGHHRLAFKTLLLSNTPGHMRA